MSDPRVEDIDVLIVEDSPTQAFLLQASLEEHKMKVRVAGDGIEALQKMQEALPHVIISDIEMPQMDGYSFCSHVKSNPEFRSIPVILLTNLSDPMDVVRGIECGCDSFLTKPYEMNFLLSTIYDARENTKLHQGNSSQKKLDFFFNGKRLQLQVNQEQITGLLLSIYSSAIQKNLELQEAYHQLNLFSEELQKKNEELKELNQIKNQFLEMAAHDLRNPLGIISGYSDVLTNALEGNINEKSIKMLDRIKTSSAMMLQLINDLLDASVAESGTISLQLSPTDLPALIQENLVLLKGLAEKKDIELKLNYKDPVPLVNCDPNKVTQILNNLISNAIKFSKPGDSIEIAVIPLYADVKLVVKDHGAGLSPEAKKQLFQPFSKDGLIDQSKEKGTGLGLAMAQKIVEEHKGRIWVESEPGKGSTFFITLPYAPTIR